MLKKSTLSSWLLAAAILTGGSIQTTVAQDTAPSQSNPTPTAPADGSTVTPTVEPIPPQQMRQMRPDVVLTLQDLPSGFQELPPEIKSQIASRLEAFGPQLAQAGLKAENFFAYVNPSDLQLVAGFTGMLSSQSEQDKFDASVKQMQEPEARERMINQLREALKAASGVEFVGYSVLPEMNNIAQASTGMSLTVSMEGQPVRMDIASFRRNTVGVFATVMYTDGKTPSIGLSDVARKLDNRIEESSPTTNPAEMTAPR